MAGELSHDRVVVSRWLSPFGWYVEPRRLAETRFSAGFNAKTLNEAIPVHAHTCRPAATQYDRLATESLSENF